MALFPYERTSDARAILAWTVNVSYSIFNPYLTNGFAHHFQLGESTFILAALGVILNYSIFDEIVLSKQNSPAASHLGLYCLSMSHKRDARFK